MPINPTELDDTPQDISPDFQGTQVITLAEATCKVKENKAAWFLLKFDGDGGRASASFNWFGNPDTEGRKKANDISWHQVVKPLAKAAGLNDGDLPAKTAMDIAKFLNAYEGKLRVSAFIGTDERGYNVASKFKAA
jgi:hypothetical protein